MGIIYKTILIIFLSMSFDIFADSKVCSKIDENDTEEIATKSKINDWRIFHLFFKRFSHCDSAGTGEAISEVNVSLMVSDWANLNILSRLFRDDPKFEKFVFRHIDATANFDQIKKIQVLALKNCSSDLKALCVRLAQKARKAEMEMSE